MIGRIEELVPERRAGFIRTSDGVRVLFRASAVVGHGYDLLTVGQGVSFDLERDLRGRRAVGVRQGLLLSKTARKTGRAMELRYMGFDQAQNTREYRFDGIAAGEIVKHFVISVDVALFVKHRVGMQEGPSLCLRKLSADLEAPARLCHQLTNDDLGVYASALAAAAERKASSRKSRNFKRPAAAPAQ